MKNNYFGETIIDKFCNNANIYSDNIAVVYLNETITYQELDKKSTQIAWMLKSVGIEKDDVVGIMMERSIDLLVGILGVMKASGTYLPLDIIYPVDRINYILEDSSCRFLLLNAPMNEEIVFEGQILNINDINLLEEKLVYEDQKRSQDSNAYILYTSGSTGVPKGVAISHFALTSFFEGITKRILFQRNDRILAVTTISFDISILELLIPLGVGMTIVLADSKIAQNPRRLVEYIKNQEVNLIQMTPTRMSLLLECLHTNDWLKSVKTILIGGESFPMNLLERLKRVTDARIYNMYGPTESTIWVTVAELTDEMIIHIGIPLEGCDVLILDEQQNPVKQGETGELCITGNQLSSGYVNKPELTRKRFIQTKWNPNQILYRTGDYGFLLTNGNFVCKGRIDEQVKVRGYRIELNEVTQALLKCHGIRNAVVLAMDGKNDTNFLCAYYEAECKLEEEVLRKCMNKYVPYYMIPEQFVWMEHLPETLNQKVDKKQLMNNEKGV